MPNESWRAELSAVLEMLTTCSPLRKRSPKFVEAARARLAKLSAERARVTVAGAQGVGKSTLVSALLASPRFAGNPVPVSEREETRMPIIARWGPAPLMRDIFADHPEVHEGEFSEGEVRRRASVDRTVFDRLAFGAMLAVELEHPGFDLPPHIDVVDLPGVSGHLAGVSEWAGKYLLSDSTQCTIFLVASNQTIDCVEDEANLVRAYGPLMTRVIFVQNVWSDYDDPVDQTEEKNKLFLSKHIGEAYHYLRLDCDQALLAKRAGAPELVAPLLDRASPILGGRRPGPARGGARAARLHVAGTIENVEAALLEARGQGVEARKARERMASRLAEAERQAAVLFEAVNLERRACGQDLAVSITTAFTDFEAGLTEYIEGDRSLTPKLLEREIARLAGELNRTIRDAVVARLAKATSRLKEQLGREVDGADAAMPGAEFSMPAFDDEMLRKFVRGFSDLLETGAGVAGAAIGGFIGNIPGAIIGGAIGMFIGWVAKKMIRSEIREAASARTAQRDPVEARPAGRGRSGRGAPVCRQRPGPPGGSLPRCRGGLAKGPGGSGERRGAATGGPGG